MRELLLQQFPYNEKEVQEFCDYFFDGKNVENLDADFSIEVIKFLHTQFKTIAAKVGATKSFPQLTMSNLLYTRANSLKEVSLQEFSEFPQILRATYFDEKYLARVNKFCLQNQNKKTFQDGKKKALIGFNLFHEASLFANGDPKRLANLMLQAKDFFDSAKLSAETEGHSVFEREGRSVFEGRSRLNDLQEFSLLAQSAICKAVQGDEAFIARIGGMPQVTQDQKAHLAFYFYSLAKMKEDLAQNDAEQNDVKALLDIARDILKSVDVAKTKYPQEMYRDFSTLYLGCGESGLARASYKKSAEYLGGKSAWVFAFENLFKSFSAFQEIFFAQSDHLFVGVEDSERAKYLSYLSSQRNKIKASFRPASDAERELTEFCLNYVMRRSKGKDNNVYESAFRHFVDADSLYFENKVAKIFLENAINFNDPERISQALQMLKESHREKYRKMTSVIVYDLGDENEMGHKIFAAAMQSEDFVKDIKNAIFSRDSSLQIGRVEIIKNLLNYYLDEISKAGSAIRVDECYKELQKIVDFEMADQYSSAALSSFLRPHAILLGVKADYAKLLNAQVEFRSGVYQRDELPRVVELILDGGSEHCKKEAAKFALDFFREKIELRIANFQPQYDSEDDVDRMRQLLIGAAAFSEEKILSKDVMDDFANDVLSFSKEFATKMSAVRAPSSTIATVQVRPPASSQRSSTIFDESDLQSQPLSQPLSQLSSGRNSVF